MNRTLVTLVRQRARERCEYCHLPEALSAIPFEIDHIIATKHGGSTSENNLALTCFYCNSAKGPNIAGIAADTRKVVALFNPRRQNWSRHFKWNGPVLVGRTLSSRVTIEVLSINASAFVSFRKALIAAHVFPLADQ